MIRIFLLLLALAGPRQDGGVPQSAPQETPSPAPTQTETPSPTPSPTDTPPPSPSPTPTKDPDVSVTIQDSEGYIVAELRGAGSYDQNTQKGMVRDGRVIYYYYPKTRSVESKTLQLNIAFPVGDIDGRNFRFNLTEGATVTMQDGTRLDASELLIDRNPKPGTPQILSTRPIRLTKPGMVLSGPGLEANDSLNSLLIPKDGYLEIQGRPQDFAPGRVAPPVTGGPLTVLRSHGPLAIRRLEGPDSFTFISASDGVNLNRSEEGRSAQLSADSLVLYLQEQDRNLAPVSATARGAITIIDSTGAKATASSFDWDARNDVVRLVDVDMSTERQKIRAQSAMLDRVSGVALFTGRPSAEVPIEPGQPPLRITAKSLALELSATGTSVTPSKVAARGDVRIVGHFGSFEKSQPIDAAGIEFTWNAFTGSGRLSGRPYARILQGESLIEAPLILFEGRSLIVVKGPKAVNFVHLEPPPLALRARNTLFGLDLNLGGKRTTVSVSTLADISYDSDSRRLTVLDRCEVRTDDFILAADRLQMRLNENGKDVEMAHAIGHVRLERPSEGVHLAGDVIAYRPVSGEIDVAGSPRAFATLKDAEVSAPVLRYDRNRKKVWAISR